MRDLVVAPCARDAAKYAVLNWHYSQRMPTGRLVSFGVWESGAFIGAVVFGRGANDRMLRPFGLRQSQGCELVRVALTKHDAPVSQAISRALRLLSAHSSGLRIVVSYADPEHDHHGGIYQAGNWIYLGVSAKQTEWVVNGTRYHARSISALRESAAGDKRIREGETWKDWLRRVYDPNSYEIEVPPKHRYVMPLDRAMRRQVTRDALPYPRPAVEGSEVTRCASGTERQVRSLSTALDSQS